MFKAFIVHEHRSQCRKSRKRGTAKPVSHLCVQLLLQFYVLYTVSLSYEGDEIDWGLQSNWRAFTTSNTSRIYVQWFDSIWARNFINVGNLKIFHCYILLKGTEEMIPNRQLSFSFFHLQHLNGNLILPLFFNFKSNLHGKTSPSACEVWRPYILEFYITITEKYSW